MKQIIFISIFIFWDYLCFGATTFVNTDSLQRRISLFGTMLPQEKVYLHLDNTCYFVGDTIWYKGYVTRSDKGTLTDMSKILYVELLTPDGFLVERQQLEMPNGTANGAFVLTDSLYAGYYELRAYTRWMLNFGQYEHPHAQWSEDAFYNKEMAKDFFRDYEKLYSRVFPVYDKPKETGHYTKDMTLRPLRRYFKARKGKPELELKFYPEGGNLVAGTDCNVALELNTEEGEHLENVEIDILDPQGRNITRTRTGNRGRCTFILHDVASEEGYKAVFQYKGYDYEVKLPEVEEEGIALQVRQDTLLRIELQRSEGLTDFPEGLALQVMAQGIPQTLQHIDFGDKRKTNVTIPLNELRTGVNQITVFDGKGQIYADRLCFVNRHGYDSARIDIHGIEPQYEPFAPVTLNLKLQDIQDTATSVSLAVRDRATEEQTYDNGTMLTEMMLASEIKGFVENPGYYFLQQDLRTLRTVDFLMMTHGWRRHHIQNVLTAPSMNLTNYMEKGQTISGRIKGFFGGNVKKGPICILAPKQNIIATTTTDEKGEFIVNTSFRDSTTFLVQARTKRGFAGVDIVIDTPQYPATSHKSPFHDGTATFMEDYLLNTRDQYYMEGGMRVYNLKEVVVTGSRKKASSESIYTGGINTYTIEGDRLEGFGAQTAFDAVTRLPGISVTNGNEIHIRNNPEQPVIVVDDVVYEDDNDILTMIQTSDMSSLSLLRGADAAILGSRGSAGAIVITLKDGKDIPARPAQGIITCTPLGYSDSVEFYHPTYDTPEKKNDQRSDLRSTIYWNPSLQLDANGKAIIEYYTPDSTAPEDITIEGVDKNGKVCRIVQTINNR